MESQKCHKKINKSIRKQMWKKNIQKTKSKTKEYEKYFTYCFCHSLKGHLVSQLILGRLFCIDRVINSCTPEFCFGGSFFFFLATGLNPNWYNTS